MTTKGMGNIAAVLLGLAVGPLWAGTEGAGSTFYGSGAGASNSVDGNLNTFVGANAGIHTTSGTYNAFFGEGAGYQNTTSSFNSFFGLNAGYSNTTSTQNTYFGYAAGYSGTTSNGYNTFVGAGAGFLNTSSYNTFIGRSAGYSNTTGNSNSFLGEEGGASNTTGSFNTFLGGAAGYHNTTGYENSFVGANAGAANTTGYTNTFLGVAAGANNFTGHDNVFLGARAGASETGSNVIYIDNCFNGGGTCISPFIYGEFDNHLLNINGVTSVAADSVAKSQMHFSLDNGDYGGFLTSVLQNNFFVSSGARYDSTAGGWIQRSADGNAMIAGSGAVGYRIFSHTGGVVGSSFTLGTPLLFINYSGEFGINTAPVGGHQIHTSGGAYLAGGTWTDASSRAYKHDIHELPAAAAADALAALNPVMFRYNDDDQQQHVGFIAEDVPELVAMKDRKGLSPMDIVAVLTKVVQEQKQQLQAERARGDSMEERLAQIEARLGRQ